MTLSVETDGSWGPFPVDYRDGKVRLARPHIATFHGIHNHSKSRVVLVLCHRRFTLKTNTGLTARQLSEQSGIGHRYLKDRLHKWIEWQYLKRERAVSPTSGLPCFSYTIAARGILFVEKRIPPQRLIEYTAAIRQFQHDNKVNLGAS